MIHQSKVRFYGDESVPTPVRILLGKRGYIVLSCSPRLRGKMDVLHLLEATKLQAILLTVAKDSSSHDFPVQRIEAGAGVVIVTTSDPTPKHYRRIVRKLLKHLSKNSLTGLLCVASIESVRVLGSRSN